MQIKFTVKTEEISKYPKRYKKIDQLGCMADACRATQSSLCCAGIKSAGK